MEHPLIQSMMFFRSEQSRIKISGQNRELDSDLYDRVGYLNLMSQYEERERQRKFDEMENLRRLREEFWYYLRVVEILIGTGVKPLLRIIRVDELPRSEPVLPDFSNFTAVING
uniref:Uncharacterized protein n=1 Tax=Parascaris equorum TaxID=6256 RepID=A0A914R6Y9_PAREQ